MMANMQSVPTAEPKMRIAASPGVCGGKPCVAGTRIRVQDIYVWHELQGRSADEIVSGFPQLTMADVYAALSYFWEHREDILRQMADEELLAAELKARSPSLLREKLQPTDGPNDQIPSR
jgi:uncharacterized protein (DUF433 family)